jgi:uncharacterized membrane protein YtjA (UPF0391 family)
MSGVIMRDLPPSRHDKCNIIERALRNAFMNTHQRKLERDSTMFRTVSILGLGVVCLITALIAALFSFRIAVEENWMMAKVVFFIFLILAVLAFAGVYMGRRREV